MSNNSPKNGHALYFVIGALLVIVLGLGYYVMKEETDKPGVKIEVSEDGIKID